MSRIFHIGDKVYPVRIDGSQCNATKEDMSYLYGIVVDLSVDMVDGSRQYSVEWLDARTNDPAEFDHGLKNSWFEANELSSALDGYMNMLNSLSFDEEDDDDGGVLEEIIAELCDIVDDELVHLCGMYGLDPYEYADTIKQQLCNNLQ